MTTSGLGPLPPIGLRQTLKAMGPLPHLAQLTFKPWLLLLPPAPIVKQQFPTNDVFTRPHTFSFAILYAPNISPPSEWPCSLQGQAQRAPTWPPPLQKGLTVLFWMLTPPSESQPPALAENFPAASPEKASVPQTPKGLCGLHHSFGCGSCPALTWPPACQGIHPNSKNSQNAVSAVLFPTGLRVHCGNTGPPYSCFPWSTLGWGSEHISGWRGHRCASDHDGEVCGSGPKPLW